MDFKLPESIASKLSGYDPSVPKLRGQSQKPAKPASIGRPDDLLPSRIVSKADQLAAVDRIRLLAADSRWQTFEKDGKFVASIYHHKGTWVGLWLEPGILYGFKYATKNPDSIRCLSLHWSETKYGRSTLKTTSQVVTIDDIKRDYLTSEYWSQCGKVSNWKAISERIHTHAIDPVFNYVKGQLPQWEDRTWGGIFERTLLLNPNNLVRYGRLFTNTVSVFDPASVIEKFRSNRCNSMFDLPSIKKLITVKVNEITSYCSDPTSTKYFVLQGMWDSLVKYSKWIEAFSMIWPQTPPDYFVNEFDSLSKVSAPFYVDDRVKKWLNVNASPAILLNLIVRHAKSEDLHSVRDTLTMMTSIDIDDLKPPARWRDLHDHVAAIQWKKNTKLDTLPQDLFPTPLKFDGWTFFQPSDTHQLADWGRVVRNCVGGAGYADGVKKKKHLIVLCMYENKPTFTVQLKIESGRMHVSQIVKQSNARLSEDENQTYTDVFGKALALLG